MRDFDHDRGDGVRVGSNTREAALIGVLLLAIVAVSYLLSLSLFQVALLVTLLAVGAVVAFVPGAWPTLYRSTGISPPAWLAALAVVATGLGLSYVVGDPQPFCERSVVRGCITAYGYASAVWIASGLAVAVGHLGRYRLLRGTATEPATDASEGPVAVEGRIAPAGGTRPGPVSGEPTVWYHAVTERPTVFDGHLRTDAETAGDRFYVEDGSGRLLVVPDRIDRHDAASGV